MTVYMTNKRSLKVREDSGRNREGTNGLNVKA